jgi:hypothetical protein
MLAWNEAPAIAGRDGSSTHETCSTLAFDAEGLADMAGRAVCPSASGTGVQMGPQRAGADMASNVVGW